MQDREGQTGIHKEQQTGGGERTWGGGEREGCGRRRRKKEGRKGIIQVKDLPRDRGNGGKEGGETGGRGLGATRVGYVKSRKMYSTLTNIGVCEVPALRVILVHIQFRWLEKMKTINM